MHDADFGSTAATKDGGLTLTSDDFGRVGTSGNPRALLVEGLFELDAQVFGGLVADGFAEEIAVVLASEAVAFVVENEDGFDFGKERREVGECEGLCCW